MVHVEFVENVDSQNFPPGCIGFWHCWCKSHWRLLGREAEQLGSVDQLDWKLVLHGLDSSCFRVFCNPAWPRQHIVEPVHGLCCGCRVDVVFNHEYQDAGAVE